MEGDERKCWCSGRGRDHIRDGSDAEAWKQWSGRREWSGSKGEGTEEGGGDEVEEGSGSTWMGGTVKVKALKKAEVTAWKKSGVAIMVIRI